MAHINYDIPDDIHRKAKSRAAIEGITLKEYIIKALKEKEVGSNGR